MMHFTATTILVVLQTLNVFGLPRGSLLHPRQQPLTEAFAERGYFFVGGEYVNKSVGGGPKDQYMQGQMYVERLTPSVVKHKHPLVFIHGLAQTAANWLNTPDDREGWASYFLRQGYVVYLSDQPQRGRSPWIPGEGDVLPLSTTSAIALFTAYETLDPLPFPQAKLHTQWPGSGKPGDPIFDAFFASQIHYQSDPIMFSKQNNHSYISLLDHIGEPVVLVTHSQAGPFGWQIGDARPDLAAGIVALEPGAPPFKTWTGPPYAPGYFQEFPPTPYGITILPIAYDPPLADDDPSALQYHQVAAPDDEKTPCNLQTEPARQLENLARVPVLQIVGEASFQAPYSYCVAEYLNQAGVPVDFVKLGDAGIHGNGHFSFIEQNNLEVAEKVVMLWLRRVEQISH